MQIYLLLTEKCNLDCLMCIRGKQEGEVLKLDILKNIKEELAEHDIVLTGGEPTLHKEFCNIVDFMCENCKKVTVTSNGTTDYYLKKIKNRENLFFQISIDGDKNKHNSIRGNGTFEKTINTIEKLDRLGFKYSVASVVSKKNIDSMFALADILKNLNNIRFWKISYEMPFGSADFNEIMSAEEWNKFVDKMIDYAKLRLRIKKIFPFELYNSRMNDLNTININRSFNCGSGKNKIYIYPDLNIYPCTCLTDFCLGNLKKTSLKEVLEGDKIKKFMDYKILQDTACFNCKYNKFCNGGCIGMSYHYYGTLGKGDIRCPKLQMRK